MLAALAVDTKTAYLPFTSVETVYFDVLGSPDDHDTSARLDTDPAPAGWTRQRVGPWVCLGSPGQRPAAGWKVHVSATPAAAPAAVRAALRVCFDLGVSAKTLATVRAVHASQHKYASVTASGKVLTAYPDDEAALSALVPRLRTALAGLPGPRVLGDLPVQDAAVSLRFGAFAESWTSDRVGTPRPALQGDTGIERDHRGYGWRALAPALPPHLADLIDDAGSTQLPVSDVTLIHRSNAGGVYRARWHDGRRVVLKEARRHAGLDLAGHCAVERLRHETRALRRLQGTGVAPEVIDHLELGDAEVLVMSEIDGVCLMTHITTRHPGLRADATTADRAAYAASVDAVHRALQGACAVLRRHGIHHGDLHPGNVMLAGDQVVLLDFESCSIDGVGVAEGVAAFGRRDRSGAATAADDRHALAETRLAMITPHASLTRWRPDLRGELEDDGWAGIRGIPTIESTLSEVAAGAMQQQLLRGLSTAVTPHRRDRLFPGDIAQFTVPQGGLGLLNGAAGVLLAVQAIGADVPGRWVDWLIERATARPLGWGLAHGAAGVALALGRLGRPEAARRVLDQARAAPQPLPWWAFGTVGDAVAHAHLAVLLGDRDLAARAGTDLEQVAEMVHLSPDEGHGGLLHGWSGVALGVLAVADTRPLDEQPDLWGLALRALRRDLARLRRHGEALFSLDGNRLLPYLGGGVAAAALAADALLERDRTASCLDDADVRALREVRDGALATLTQGPGMVSAGLLNGRSGVLAVARRLLGDEHPAVLAHVARLAWHCVPVGEGSVLTGDTGLRLSADVATGSAGAMLALAPRRAEALAQVLALPRRM